MAQLEIEKASSQLAEARKLLQTLDQIPLNRTTGAIRSGSLVYTNQGNYFLSIPAGELTLDGATYFALSPASPLGSALMGKLPGAIIQFNQREIAINRVD